MLRIMNSLVGVIVVVSFVLVPLQAVADTEVLPATPSVIHPLITELKVRNDSTGYDEFIELYNPSDTSIDLSLYALHYYNVLNPGPAVVPSKKTFGTSEIELAPYTHTLFMKKPTVLGAFTLSSSWLDANGIVQLVYGADEHVVDQIGWTNNIEAATVQNVFPPVLLHCTEGSSCTASTQSFTRFQNEAGVYSMEHPQWALHEPSPGLGEQFELPDNNEEVLLPDDTSVPPDSLPVVLPLASCEGVVITELLPNPDGADTGREFIELLNTSTDFIPLEGCALQTSANSRTYVFGDVTLSPGEYLALKDSLTGLTLPNVAGGTVWLIDVDESEIQNVVYAPGLDEDVAWAVFAGQWRQTYAPSPGVENINMSQPLCPEGQTRDSLTGKCQVIVSAASMSLVSCKPGQERNPLTNRCRTIARPVTAGTGLVPCKPGQERNPETNRCRMISISDLAPCPEGQERNSETNRCRKIAAAGNTLAAVTDVPSVSTPPSPKWWIAFVAIAVALGYAAYEWRQDVRQAIVHLTERLIRR